jgi:dCMP deaminase
MTRLSREAWAMEMATLTARRSTCLRRAVGCVLVDKDYFVLATGFNGVAAGEPHCNEADLSKMRVCGSPPDTYADGIVYPNACPAHDSPSGSNLAGCHALHAEWNALIRCHDPREIHAAFVTASPCIMCTKMLMNTGCQHIYFLEHYAHHDAKDLWLAHGQGRTWQQMVLSEIGQLVVSP